MIRDGEVLEPRSTGGLGHGRHAVLAVGFGRVGVQIAAQVVSLDEPRQTTRLGGFDLASCFAKLGWNPVEAEGLVHLVLRLSRDALVSLHTEQAVLVELQAAAHRAVAKRDVVRLRSGEVLQRRPTALARYEAQVGL